MNKLFIISILFCSVCNADPNLGFNWDHFGTTYAIQTFTYGFAEKGIGLTENDSYYFSTVITFVGTFLYTYIKAFDSGRGWQSNNTNAFIFDRLGQAASIGTCLTFHF